VAYKNEEDMIVDKLADIRENLFDETDFISDDGWDMLPSYVGSPYEVLCGMETKIKRQQLIVEAYERMTNR
jgi:hypothetical protein